ncbi:F-box only protein 9 [Nymphalis io]|uniref:F-box only protein 9 n=1 Tax=Inachis io TaxID=171585 RepID=UPI0021685A5D|nr:F-box only protein 9 [Nymphalis io]XP_050349161.1 F-box only protein 9 [Nymphalis io]
MESASGSGSAGDCEGEGEESSSSSSHSPVVEISNGLVQLNLDKERMKDELTAFRREWKKELEATPSPCHESRSIDKAKADEEPLTEEEKAKKLFLGGVELERAGKLYEAIQHYKKSIQIVPDIERRLFNELDLIDTPEEEAVIVESTQSKLATDDDEDAVEGEDLLTRLQRIMARKGHLCEPEFSTRGAHLSWLPYEVVQLVLRWVVGAELDAVSLERVGAVCRGLFVASRAPELWRCLCVRTWGIECGTPRAHGYSSWRHMFVERARLNLHGCYISKTSYLRHGENSFQDHLYRPWYVVHYYRYLRFFPEGLVLMWTTAEEPASCVGYLRYRDTRNIPGIVSGHYRLVGDTVAIVIKKSSSEKKHSQASNTRFRSRRREVHEQQEQVFHLELQLLSVRLRRNSQLAWRRYAVSTRRDQTSAFELVAGKFPPFVFSVVRSYTADSSAPLSSAW